MPEPTLHSELQSLIDNATEMLSTLGELLVREQEAVKTRNLEEMQQCNTDKAALLGQIENNFQQRQALMIKAGIETTAEGWEQFLLSLPEAVSSPLRTSWQAMANSLEETHQINQVNHQLIHRSKENNDRLLSLLQGKNHRSELYGHSGKRNNFATQSRIGKA